MVPTKEILNESQNGQGPELTRETALALCLVGATQPGKIGAEPVVQHSTVWTLKNSKEINTGGNGKNHYVEERNPLAIMSENEGLSYLRFED